MGTSGPGNIVHIDNLYVKTFNVKTDVSIVLGDFVVIENVAGFAVARPLVTSDTGSGLFVALDSLNIVQAGENANNLDSTDELLKKNQIECITKGSDWTTIMAADVLPDDPVGITQIGLTGVFQVANVNDNAGAALAAGEILGVYKHKEFSTVAEISVLADNGIISTGVGLS